MLAASAVAAIAARLPTLFTAYRITPRNYSGLTNVNSGDAAGDVFFGLYEFALPIICAEQPSLINCENIPILSIPGFNIYTKSLVEADPRFSTYKGCNPDADSGVFHCEILGNHSACWYDSPQGESFSGLCDASSCRCDAFDAEAVGKDVCNMCSPNASWHPDTPIWRQAGRGPRPEAQRHLVQHAGRGRVRPGRERGLDLLVARGAAGEERECLVRQRSRRGRRAGGGGAVLCRLRRRRGQSDLELLDRLPLLDARRLDDQGSDHRAL